MSYFHTKLRNSGHCGAKVCLSQYCCRSWERKIRTPPKIPSCCITHSREIICPLRFLQIYFLFTHDVLFMTWLSLVSRSSPPSDRFVCNSAGALLEGIPLFSPEKICSGVMQMFLIYLNWRP